jgi:hypothetical protein
MLNILVISLVLFTYLFLKFFKKRNYLIITYLFLLFINIWVPLFIFEETDSDLYLGNSLFYKPILYWLTSILILIFLNPLRYINLSFSNLFRTKIVLIPFSEKILLINYFIFFIILFNIGTSNVYLIAFISSIAAILAIKNKKYYILFLIIVTLLAVSFQRSLVVPFVFLFFLKLYRQEISFKQVFLFCLFFVMIFYIALVGRGLVNSSSFSEIIKNLSLNKENINILTSNVSNVNIGSVAFEMNEISPTNLYDIFEYFFNILIPLPSTISNFDFQKFYVSRYLGTEPSLGLPMPACYQFYYFFGNWSIFIMYFIFIYLLKMDKEINEQFSENKTNIFTYLSLFILSLSLMYFHHSDLRFFVVSTILVILSIFLSKFLKYFHVIK